MDTSNIIAIIALIVSCGTVIIELIYNQKNFKLLKQQTSDSIRPVLSIDLIKTFKRETKKMDVMMLIKNHGAGPAKITNLYYHSSEINPKNCYNNFENEDYCDMKFTNVIKQRLGEKYSDSYFREKDMPTYEYINGKFHVEYLGAGTDALLANFEIEEQYFKLFDTLFDDLWITIEYTDIHDSALRLATENLSYFKSMYLPSYLRSNSESVYDRGMDF